MAAVFIDVGTGCRLGNCCLSISSCVFGSLDIVKSGKSLLSTAAMMERMPAVAGPGISLKYPRSLRPTPSMVPRRPKTTQAPKQCILQYEVKKELLTELLSVAVFNNFDWGGKVQTKHLLGKEDQFLWTTLPGLGNKCELC